MIRLLVDTHALLWWLEDAPELSARARDAIADPGNEPFVSTATVWEIAIKRSLGKLQVPDDIVDEIDDAGFSRLPVAAEHAWVAGGLAFRHRDPFDRLLVAQALSERLPVVTRDPQLAGYGIETWW
jgi:PIN domain nuclease of toxin-antitoxin system